MSIKTSLPFLFAFTAVVGSSAAVGCSSSSSTPAGDAGITGTDGGGGDGATGGISGSKEISVTVVETMEPMNTPLANVFARIEAPGGFLEVKTDATGVAKFKVDPAKGPFDVTVAIAGYYAVSILGVTDSIPGSIILAQIGAMPSSKQFAATGSISGATATNKLQIDAFDWMTVVTKAGAMSYSTKFDTINGVPVPIPVMAIEVDSTTGDAINGSITAPVDRMAANMVINITMPSPAVNANKSTVAINWPTAGILTAALLKGVGSPVTDMHIGSGIVEQITASREGAAMFCGIANTSAPTNGVTTLSLQTFTGAMKPDIAGTEVSTIAPMKTATVTDIAALVYAHDLSASAKVDVGAITALTIDGTSLDDAQITVDSTGYDTAQIFVSNAAGMTNTTVWIIYQQGGKIAKRGLPHLPGGVKIGDLGGDLSSAEIATQVTKFISGAKPPWDNTRTDQALLIGNAKGTPLDPTFTKN